ncbi:hypothetical protein TNCV_4230831 [Trichonephila clavipes]|uniref:Uncharacterized protein n=1 Tax=Trichonephila clavipes TaxID=2585209 RepID=A0A8X6VG99_TRICX|nr:hypothetical protein TNCV_4230831 [Trichonephila clavipes]
MIGIFSPLLDFMWWVETHQDEICFTLMDPSQLCLSKGLVLPNLNINHIAVHARFLLISLPNNGMLTKSPFAINKALIGIGGESTSVKCLRSSDVLVEISSTLQTVFPTCQIFSRFSSNNKSA